LKYKGDIALGDVFARPLASQLLSYGWPVNLIVPVPIGVARKSERGYNQAALIAWPVALCAGIAYRPNALKKVRETRSQVGLPASERRTNVAEAFQADPKTVRGKSVLIMDDVTTSGATIEACTNALLSAGANQVYGLTLARAKLDHPPGGSRNPQQVEVNAASQTM
jgi:ComF family protein